jgi:hypothetical protein
MKTYIVVMIAALSAAVGESLLSFGMKRYGSMNLAEPSHWLILVSSVVRNPYVFLGVIFLRNLFPYRTLFYTKLIQYHRAPAGQPDSLGIE